MIAAVRNCLENNLKFATIDATVALKNSNHCRVGFYNNVVFRLVQLAVHETRNDPQTAPELEDRNVAWQPSPDKGPFVDLMKTKCQRAFVRCRYLRTVNRIS